MGDKNGLDVYNRRNLRNGFRRFGYFEGYKKGKIKDDIKRNSVFFDWIFNGFFNRVCRANRAYTLKRLKRLDLARYSVAFSKGKFTIK